MNNICIIVRSFLNVFDYYKSNFMFIKFNPLIFFALLVFFSCKKIEIVPIGKITGPSAVCYASESEIYFIDSLPDVNIIWTVPEDAEIISGQTTSKIKVKFGRKEGKVLANFYKNGEIISDTVSFINVTFGVPGKWCRLPNFMGGIRRSASAFTIGSKAYITTGYSAHSWDDVWEFDSDSNRWKEKENFIGAARYQGVAFSIGNNGYFGTGYVANNTVSDFWKYDPVTDSWEQMANCGTAGRQYAFGFALNNKGYIGGGHGDAGASLNDFYEYSPLNNEWVQKANMVQPCHGSVAFVIGNKAYMGTGRDELGYRTEFWEFDPTDVSNGLDANNNPLGKWISKADFPGTGRYFAVAFSINNKGYLGTGSVGSTEYKKDLWEYDPTQNSWTEKDSMAVGRGYSVGFSINGKGYVGTGIGSGIGSNILEDFYVYTQ